MFIQPDSSVERVSTQELINKALSNYTTLHDHFETETSSLRARAKELEDVVDKQAKENVSALQQVGWVLFLFIQCLFIE